MPFSLANMQRLSPLMRSMVANGSRFVNRTITTGPYATTRFQPQPMGNFAPKFCMGCHQSLRQLGSNVQYDDKPVSLTTVLDREIQEETAELNQRLQSDQFPGFSVEADDADVKLTKHVGDATVVVRFTVSSSLSEWRSNEPEQEKQNTDEPGTAYSLLSLPEFQVQISRDNKTLEISCYFDQIEHDEETGEAYPMDPTFNIDEMVMYEGEPRDTEFAVSAEYFREELQEGLIQYLADHAIDDEFAKNLVSYATNYEKKQYIGLMKRLREFVSK